MKRITFVFIGILAITASVLLLQNTEQKLATKIVKLDTKKPKIKGIYD